MNRCTGHCCRRFPLPVAPDELDLVRERCEDGVFVADMLVHIEPATEPEPRPGQGPQAARGEVHYYTCRHFNTDTGNCQEYENRPAMCRNFPYGDTCSYKACTWADAKTGGCSLSTKDAVKAEEDHADATPQQV